jgi:transcriptional regulator with XRE-family HTH domain
MAKENPDRVMKKARRAFESSGMSLEQLGQRMGYEEGIARRAAWQFLNKTSDPRLSMLRRFSEAVDVDLKELL